MAGGASNKGNSSAISEGPTSVPPIYSFEEATDYVYDVRWHPVNPAVFGSVDGTGKFDLWNLNVATEVRVSLFLSSRSGRGCLF